MIRPAHCAYKASPSQEELMPMLLSLGDKIAQMDNHDRLLVEFVRVQSDSDALESTIAAAEVEPCLEIRQEGIKVVTRRKHPSIQVYI